jgi:hypothetical protein
MGMMASMQTPNDPDETSIRLNPAGKKEARAFTRARLKSGRESDYLTAHESRF